MQNSKEIIFHSKFDGRTIFYTAFLLGLLALPGILLMWLYFQIVDGYIIILGFAIYVLIVSLTILFCYLRFPRAYILTHAKVIISSPIKKISIPLYSIKNVRRASSYNLKRSARLFGINGLFGEIGEFRSPALGKYHSEATSTKDKVIIFADKRYIVTPSNPIEFIEAVLSKRFH